MLNRTHQTRARAHTHTHTHTHNGGGEGIAARGQIYMGTPIGVVEIHLQLAAPPSPDHHHHHCARAHTHTFHRAGNWETVFTCLYPFTVQTRPLAGTASGIASDSVRSRGFTELNHYIILYFF